MCNLQLLLRSANYGNSQTGQIIHGVGRSSKILEVEVQGTDNPRLMYPNPSHTTPAEPDGEVDITPQVGM